MPTLLKQTHTRCTTCHARIDGRVVNDDGKVFLERMCPEHGYESVCISSDARFYYDSRGSGCGTGCGCGPDETSATSNPFDTLSTCLALIEVVDSCNMACPTCFANSPTEKDVDYIPLAEIKSRVENVIAKKGGIEILQLSGGEPTLHPDFFELLEFAQAHDKIDDIIINTNGIRIARDAAFAEALNRSYQRGKVQVYLQYDGPQEAGQRTIRGADYRKVKHQALERTGAFEGGGLPVTLAMTVIPENLDYLWATVALGLEYPHVRGVAFQPAFTSGRATTQSHPLNTADVILGLVAQSEGVLSFDHFTPLPCGDPNCATIGYLLKTDAGIRSMGEFIDYKDVQGFLQNRVNYNLQDLAQCGCDSEPLGDLLKRFELDESNTFRLFIKPFMDAHTWDEDRIDRCCTHIIRPDGELDSFCRYYARFDESTTVTQCCDSGGSCCG